MELGLSLGDASKPFGFMEKAPQVTNKSISLGFCMGLSMEEEKEDEDSGKHNNLDNSDHETAGTAAAHAMGSSVKDSDRSSSIDPPPIQLELLPNTPVPRSHNNLSWPSSDHNGSHEAGFSGNVARGFDVNRFPVAVVEDAEDGVAVSSSPPNSAASSLQMDFCIYNKGGNEAEVERASSRASDDDENGCTRKKLRLSKEQSAFLEESFKEHNTLNPKQKLALSKQLNLRPRQVEVWFQNRRARTKLKQTEVDCEYLKRCCETLKEENRRLHKELQELRALKTSNPFFMQLPATTLTMCPSCERVVTASTVGAATTTITAATTTNNKDSTDTTTKATGLSFNRPRFYPFSHAQAHTHPPSAS